ncbi:MAG: LysM peptidoglycan-binding domain-containing protein [Victivallales bacterium]
MPPGIYVPQPTSKTPVPGETTPEAIGPAPGTAEFKEQVSQKEESFIIEPVEQVQPTPPVKQQETKKPAPAITDKDTTYVVKKGDSLWKISRTYGISIAELAAYNNIAPSKPIRIGQKLIIPAGSNAVRTAKPPPPLQIKKPEKRKRKTKRPPGKREPEKRKRQLFPQTGFIL